MPTPKVSESYELLQCRNWLLVMDFDQVQSCECFAQKLFDIVVTAVNSSKTSFLVHVMYCLDNLA